MVRTRGCLVLMLPTPAPGRGSPGPGMRGGASEPRAADSSAPWPEALASSVPGTGGAVLGPPLTPERWGWGVRMPE